MLVCTTCIVSLSNQNLVQVLVQTHLRVENDVPLVGCLMKMTFIATSRTPRKTTQSSSELLNQYYEIK